MAALMFLVVDSRYCVLAFIADLYRWDGDVVLGSGSKTCVGGGSVVKVFV
jgi:hypothetical protein